MKKILIIFTIIISTILVAEEITYMDKLYYGGVIKVIENIKRIDNKFSPNENMQEISEVVSKEVYEIVEDDYTKEYNQYINYLSKIEKKDTDNLTQEENIKIFENIIKKIILKYTSINTEVFVNINNNTKNVIINISEIKKFNNYDKQIFEALLTNIVKGFTSEEYNIKINK